ncbi:putative MORF4 family-associated protein 1-like protein UPP [Daubentonia madagascariensis]|uniref:MORF4 family-associated protein 1-like protein UPP n=1 Tax=Daubentonia madagascariensis TaxID=31869 RepID=A0ABD2EMQ2_DAUMA
MRPVDADEAREPEEDLGGLRSPTLRAGREDLASLEREHVRARCRARRTLMEIESLLDEIRSEVEASEGSALGPARRARAEAEERVVRLCAKVEKKAVEAARMGRRIVELHRQMGGCECH